MQDRILLEGGRLQLTLDRLCHQIIENHGDFDNTCLLGVQVRGVKFANRLHQNLCRILNKKSISVLLGTNKFSRRRKSSL